MNKKEKVLLASGIVIFNILMVVFFDVGLSQFIVTGFIILAIFVQK